MPETSSPAVDEVVLDTNVLLDWLVFDDPAAQPIVQALVAGQMRWVATEAMWNELAAVLAGPLSDARSRPASTALQRATPFCCRVEPPRAAQAATPRCADTSDQMFIDLALSRAVRWLISRDKALLRLAAAARPHRVGVVSPEQWAAAMLTTAAGMTPPSTRRPA
jgi:uncharacterized protein